MAKGGLVFTKDILPHQWLFKTTFEHGLTDEIAEAVIAHLNGGDHAGNASI